MQFLGAVSFCEHFADRGHDFFGVMEFHIGVLFRGANHDALLAVHNSVLTAILDGRVDVASSAFEDLVTHSERIWGDTRTLWVQLILENLV